MFYSFDIVAYPRNTLTGYLFHFEKNETNEFPLIDQNHNPATTNAVPVYNILVTWMFSFYITHLRLTVSRARAGKFQLKVSLSATVDSQSVCHSVGRFNIRIFVGVQ